MPPVGSAARAAALVACAALFLPAACAIEPRPESSETPAFVLHTDSASNLFGAVDVLNLRPRLLSALARGTHSAGDWERLLSVRRAAPSPTDSALPVQGRHEIVDGRLRFTPRFAPVRGQEYWIRFDGELLRRMTSLPADVAVMDTTLLIPRASVPGTTIVRQIYPTADTLPVNLLRLYIQFSAPMSVGEAYDRVQLLDENGRVVEDAFLVVAGERELWDPERRRLTMLFDPGRIKRDLRPHEEAGLPLREGARFTLVIDSTWLDATGRPLVRSFAKRFMVSGADRVSPRWRDWQLVQPRVASREPLTLEFGEPLDHALLERLLAVKRANGSEVAGRASIDQAETRWRFIPAAPWAAGSYYIEVDTDLEDLAGNNLRHLFDVDRRVPARPGEVAARISIPFVLR